MQAFSQDGCCWFGAWTCRKCLLVMPVMPLLQVSYCLLRRRCFFNDCSSASLPQMRASAFSLHTHQGLRLCCDGWCVVVGSCHSHQCVPAQLQREGVMLTSLGRLLPWSATASVLMRFMLWWQALTDRTHLMAHVLSSTTPASAAEGALVYCCSPRTLAMTSESLTFIWQPMGWEHRQVVQQPSAVVGGRLELPQTA